MLTFKKEHPVGLPLAAPYGLRRYPLRRFPAYNSLDDVSAFWHPAGPV